jgi:hypothetical protein
MRSVNPEREPLLSELHCYKGFVRRPSRFIAVWCLISANAFADNADFHATAVGSVATTDNVNGSARNRRGSVFTDVRPGMLFTYNAPRNIHELITEVDLFYYFGRTQPNVTFRGDWKAFFLPGPRSEVSLGATGQRGQLNALSAGTISNENPLLVLPEGKVNTNNASATEHASWVATEFTRLFQRGFTRYTTTEDTDPMIAVKTESFEAGGAVGFDHRLRHDSFVFEVGGSYLYLKKDDPFLRQMGSRLDKQVNPRAVAVWQHDFNRQWSSSVDAGVVYVNPIFNLTGDTKPAPFPIFGVIGAYTDVWGRAQLQARRQVTPNLFLAQNTVSDSVAVTFAMPLTWFDRDSRKRSPKVVGIGTLGVDRTQLIDPSTAGLKGEFQLARLDLAVGWQPRPGQTLGLRYEVTYQHGDELAEMVIPSFLRNTFYFTYSLRWPEDVQVRVPRRNQSVRADKRDLAPIGAEPVVIDPAELLEEDNGRER